MMTSRGCPYRCCFCDRPHLGKRFRAHSATYVVDEIEECKKLGIREILLYDDTFTVNKERVLSICDEIQNRQLNISWDIRTRVDNVDEAMLEKLKQAGCRRIHYGVESGTSEILKILRKDIDLQKTKDIFATTRVIGIKTLAYFMIGSPTETQDQINKTIDFMMELQPDFVHISITTPFPATDLYRLGLERGILKSDYWREFSRKPTADFVPKVWEENFTREQLVALRKLAYRRFYLRPKYIFKQISRIKSWRDLKIKGKLLLGLLSKE